MLEICIFARCKQQWQDDMTQREALKRALDHLGGRAQLQDLYPLVLKDITYKPDSDIEATLRTTLKRNPTDFRHSPGKPVGWWELTSFQEDVAQMKTHIQELEEENERLRKVPTEDDFVERFIKQVKTFLKRDKKSVDEIRKILVALNRADAAKDLDNWIEENDTPLLSIGSASDIIERGGKKIVNNR